MSGKKNQSICDMSDEQSAADALGGTFEREDCGFFEVCNHKVEKYDMTVAGGSRVDIVYCAIDWKKVIPIIVVVFLFMLFAWKKSRGFGPRVPSSPFKSHKSKYK